MTSLLLRSARLPGPDGPGEPCDVLVADGRIAAVGSPAAPGVERVDLDGRYLLPGLWDHHVHLGQHAAAGRRLDLTGASSAAEAARLVTERVRSGTLPEVLVGQGFRDALWPDAPHRDLLDAIEHPVVLGSADLHCGWLNRAALARFASADHPTGVLREDAWYPVMIAANQVPPDVLDGWVLEAARAAAARGVVGVVELEQAPNLDDWTRRAGAGPLPLRVACGVYEPHLDDAIGRGLRTGDELAGTGGLVTMGPFKAITDGSLNTRTAYCHDPYPGLVEHPYGLLVITPDRLHPLMRRATAHGVETAIHAIGDHANELVLDAFAATGSRGSVEHAQLLTVADVPRFAALGVVASVQPEHLVDDRDVADRHWAGRTDRAFAYAALLAAGATLALGSDAPVAPLDPWITLAAAVHRTRDGRAPWHPEQAIPLDAALDASTRSRVRVGDAADLVVVEHDPYAVAPDGLRGMPVWGTLLAGRWTWRA